MTRKEVSGIEAIVILHEAQSQNPYPALYFTGQIDNQKRFLGCLPVPTKTWEISKKSLENL